MSKPHSVWFHKKRWDFFSCKLRPKILFFSHKVRVSHGKVCKVMLLWCGCTFDFFKGQLISKKIVKPRILPKNEQMNSFLLVCDMFSFVFWENPRPEKKRFEIIWPLEPQYHYLCHKYAQLAKIFGIQWNKPFPASVVRGENFL